MRREIYISVDIEADGAIPGPYSMSSFGAAVSGYRDSDKTITELYPEQDETLTFYRQLKPISDQYEPEAFQVGLIEGLPATASLEEKRQHLIDFGCEPVEAMTDFSEWLINIGETYEGVVVFAAYPLGYDWMWTYWYLMNFSNIGSPFGHSRHIDMKTAYAMEKKALIRDSVKSRMPRSLLSKRKHTHKAIDDAIEQGELLINILRINP